MCTTHGDGGGGNDGGGPHPAGPIGKGREGDGRWSKRAGPQRLRGDQVYRNYTQSLRKLWNSRKWRGRKPIRDDIQEGERTDKETLDSLVTFLVIVGHEV